MPHPLPADLVTEARMTLDGVGRLMLPAAMWPAVQENLARVDSAVAADDAGALRFALNELHWIGVGLPPGAGPPPVGVTAAPQRSPADGYGDSGGRRAARLPAAARSRRNGAWIAAVSAGLAVVAAAMFVVFGRPGASGPGVITGSAAQPSLAPPPPGTGMTSPSPTEAPASSGAGALVAVGLVVLALVVLGVVAVMVRGRSKPDPQHAAGSTGPDRPPTPPVATYAPHELVELANRTVDRLVAKSGGP